MRATRSTALAAWVVASFLAVLPLAHSKAADAVEKSKIMDGFASKEVQVRRDAVMNAGNLGAEGTDLVPKIVKAIDDEDRQVGENALAALANLGPAAKDAIPALIDCLDSRKVRGARNQGRQQSLYRAAYALSRIGAAAIPACIKALESDDTPQRQGAAIALGKMGSIAATAIPSLIVNLGHQDSELHQCVIDALAGVGKETVSPLSDALTYPDARVREGAAAALGLLGEDAASCADRIAKMAESDPDEKARGAAISVMGRLGLKPERSVPIYVSAIRSGDEGLLHAAINGMVMVRPAKPAVEAMQSLLGDADETVRKRAGRALSRMGSKAAPATADLIRCAKSSPEEPVFPEALAQIGQPALPALLPELGASGEGADDTWIFRALSGMGSKGLEALSKGLESPSAGVRAAAARAFSGLPIRQPDVIKKLAALSDDADANVRASSLRTLATIRTERETAIPKLEKALQDNAPEVRKAAAAGLAVAGSLDKLDAPTLQGLLDDADQGIRIAAMRALGDRGADGAAAVSKISAALDDAQLRTTALETLGKIGPAAESASGKILGFVHDSNRELRIGSLQALGGIGKPAETVLPLFYQGLKSDDREVRLVSLQGIVKAEPDRDKLLPILVASLKEESARMRRTAATALIPYGDSAAAAVPQLVSMLDRDSDRQAALDALRAIHVRDLPPLLTALNHRDAKVRALACELLGELGPEAKQAVPALEEKVEKDAEPVREAARKAIERINRAG